MGPAHLAAVIDGSVLCVHGGLSPDIRTLDQVRLFDRQIEIPQEGPFADLMWSDPEESLAELWAVSPRGAGYLFGATVTSEFNRVNGLELICRAHQLAMEGFKYNFEAKNLVGSSFDQLQLDQLRTEQANENAARIEQISRDTHATAGLIAHHMTQQSQAGTHSALVRNLFAASEAHGANQTAVAHGAAMDRLAAHTAAEDAAHRVRE